MPLRAENLAKRFGGVRAVDGVGIALAPGKIHALIGPNGAGKTTVLNLLSGIYRADAGRIYAREAELTLRAPHEFAAAGIGRTFQTPQIFANMSVLENVMAGRWLHRGAGALATLLRLPRLAREERACAERALGLLEFAGLERWAASGADSLPYGALKRLEIARALAAEPAALLLDEPAAGLNPSETRDLDELIRRIAGGGTAVLLVEHDMKLVMEISSHVTVLDFGRLLAEGSPQAVRADPRVIEAYLGVAHA